MGSPELKTRRRPVKVHTRRREEPVPEEERIQTAAHGGAQADMLRRQRPGEERGRHTDGL